MNSRTKSDAGLLSLPDELVLHVLTYLDNADVLQIRRVCGDLETKSIHAFGFRYFRHLLVTHHERSVARLQSVATQSRLVRHVRSITISGELSEGDLRIEWERCSSWHHKLASAIQGVPNLDMLTIDNLPPAMASKTSGISGHPANICSCIFSVAIKTLQNLILSNEPGLTLRISANGAWPYIQPSDPLWKDNSALKVSSLMLVTRDEGDNTWETNLLYSVQNLEHFNMEGNVPDPTWAKLSWPMLNTVELKDLWVPNDGFVAFVMRHSTTLSSVSLTDITILEGTWLEPLRKVTEMNKLHHVHLINLYQTDCSGEVSATFENNFSEMEPEVVLDSSDDIAVADEAFCHHFWTCASEHPGHGRHLVDFRFLRAALDGEIECEHGH